MESWKVEDTVKLAEILADMGVDLLDVSSGGNHPKQKVKTGPGSYDFRNYTLPILRLGLGLGLASQDTFTPETRFHKSNHRLEENNADSEPC